MTLRDQKPPVADDAAAAKQAASPGPASPGPASPGPASPGPASPGPASPGPAPSHPAAARSAARRWLPLGMLLVASLAGFLWLRSEGIGFDTVAEHRAWLVQTVSDNALLAGLLLFASYILATALSLPIGIVLTIVAGFLFGTWVASLWVIAGATIGSVVIFLAARTALHDTLEAKAGPWLKRMEKGFREDAFSYLLVLRLLPIVPFWLANLVPALLGVPLGTYIVATAIGIVPGTVVFASVGGGLGAILDRGETPDFGLLLEPAILLPLVGLSLLALLPVAYKRWKQRRS